MQAQRQITQLDHVRRNAINCTFRMQVEFILQACFAAWRRSQPMERLIGIEERLHQLQSIHARLEGTHQLQLASLGETMATWRTAAFAYICWASWSMRRRDTTLLKDLDGLQTLLEHYQSMERRSREYEELHRMLEQTQPACCGSRSPNGESCSTTLPHATQILPFSPVEQASTTCQEQTSNSRAMLEQVSTQELAFPRTALQRGGMTSAAMSPMRCASARQLPSPRTCWSEAQTFAR